MLIRIWRGVKRRREIYTSNRCRVHIRLVLRQPHEVFLLVHYIFVVVNAISRKSDV